MKTVGPRHGLPPRVGVDGPPASAPVDGPRAPQRTAATSATAPAPPTASGAALRAPEHTPPLPPAGSAALLAGPIDVARTALAGLHDTTTDRSTLAVLERAGRALDEVLKLSRVPTPLRLTLREDKARPAKLDVYVDRGMSGPATEPRAKVQLTPTQRDVRPFPVSPELVEGLRAGARVQLVLERTAGDQQTYKVVADDSAYAGSFAARVVKDGDQTFAVGLPSAPVYGRVPLPGAEALVGQVVVVDVANPADPSSRTGKVREVVGQGGGLSARLLEAAQREGVAVGHSAAAMAEVEALLADPRITGKDLTHLPFITIDNVGSKDLDQAMCIERRDDGGYDVHYAIADVAHFIPPDSALDREARRRTQTTYLADGHNLPMLPRELSEGLISLLPQQKRRAFVVTVSLDAHGKVESRSFQRGVVESKAQLAYSQVQTFVDGGMKGELAEQPWSHNLTLLRELGAKRVALAEARGMGASESLGQHLTVRDGVPVPKAEVRNQVEKWNEQISLLANEAVGAELRARDVRALFRTHPAPPPEKVEAFQDFVAALGVTWPEGQSVAEFVRGLDRAHPLADIIAAQSSAVNVPATYETKYAGGHSGLALDDYVHFTAPMRRYTDVVVARILGALVEGTPVPYQKPGDKTLGQVQHLAEEARRREGNLEGRQGTLLTAEWFADKLGQPLDARVVGVRPSGVRVQLAESGLVLTVPTGALAVEPGTPGVLEAASTALSVGERRFTVGQALQLSATGIDPDTGRVAFAL
jgi:VacB/RNase II family 3'-5' exoribonuclease